MDEDQLAELEIQLAAGIDLPPAMAAVQRDHAPQPQRSGAALWVVVAAVIVGFVLWLALK